MSRAPQGRARLLSGSFARSYCPHSALFRSDYSRWAFVLKYSPCTQLAWLMDALCRSNRNRGTKIIRCFPHCCPAHVDRSYCGSGLELQLQLQLNEISIDQVAVFARFEPLLDKPRDQEQGSDLAGRIEKVSDPPGALDEPQHSFAWLRSQSQGPENPTGEWTHGELSSVVDNQRSTASPNSIAATFLLNAEASARWFYHWESGANKIQRSMRHALRAFIFFMPTRSDAMELIGIVRSPTFTIVSHRRAPPLANPSASAALPAGPDGHVGEEETSTNNISLSYPSERGKPLSAELRALVKRNISRAFRDFSTHSEPQSTRQRSDEFSQTATHNLPPFPRPPRSQDLGFNNSRSVPAVPQDERAPWDRTTQEPRKNASIDPYPADFVETFRDLSVLHLFLSHVDFSETVLESPALTERVRRISKQLWGFDWRLPELLRLLCSNSGSLCRDLSSASNGIQSEPGLSSAIDFADFGSDLVDFEMLAPLLVEITVWAVSSASRTALFTHLALLGKRMRLNLPNDFYDGSQNAFKSTAQFVWLRLSEYLATKSEQSAFFHLTQYSRSSCRVRILRDALVHIIIRDRRFRPLMQHLETIFAWSSTSNHTEAYGWQSFVAQMREEYIRSRLTPTRSRTSPNTSMWDGKWLVVPNSVQLGHDNVDDRDQDWVTMWTVGTALVQLAQLDTRADPEAADPVIRIRSHGSSFTDDPSTWMALVCDGRSRVSRVLPDGRSTLSATLLGGDYTAHALSRHRLHLCFYWWPISPDGSSCIAARLKVDAVMRTGDQLCLVFQLARGDIRYPGGGHDSIECWTAAQRMESVSIWRTVGPAFRVNYFNSLGDRDASSLRFD